MSGPMVLCGHSSGTAIILCATRCGLPVAGLVLWEGPLSPGAGGAREWEAEFGGLLDARESSAALKLFMRMRGAPSELVELTETAEAYPVMVTEAENNSPDADALVWAKTAAREEVFGSVTVPVLAVAGEQTYPIMVTAAE